MSLGYGIGDVVAVGTLAWAVYKSCKGAPESFGNISMEVLSLHAVLKETKESWEAVPLPENRRNNLKLVVNGCNKVLEDLQALVRKYERLGSSKRTWNRLRWGQEDIADLRSRLTSNMVLLSAFLRFVSAFHTTYDKSHAYVDSTFPSIVVRQLDAYRDEFRDGQREGSVFTNQTVDSITADTKEVWRSIRKELEEVGITVSAFEANKELIFKWFAEAVADGKFEERRVEEEGMRASYESNRAGTRSEEDLTADVPSSTQQKIHPSARTQPKNQSPITHPNQASHLHPVGDGEGSGAQSLAPPTPKKNKRNVRVPRAVAFPVGISCLDVIFEGVVIQGNISMARKMLDDDGARSLLRPVTLGSALIRASLNAQVELVKLLLGAGADVNTADKDGRTALHETLWRGDREDVKLLLEAGADVNTADKDGRTALYWSSINGNKELVKLLLEAGANINAVDKDGQTALHLASSLGNREVVKLLLEAGADVNAENKHKRSALWLASKRGDKEVVELLLKAGADVNVKDDNGRDALNRATKQRHREVIKLLLAAGAVSTQ